MKAKIKAYDNSITSACDEILEKQGYNKDRFKGLSPQATVRNKCTVYRQLGDLSLG